MERSGPAPTNQATGSNTGVANTSLVMPTGDATHLQHTVGRVAGAGPAAAKCVYGVQTPVADLPDGIFVEAFAGAGRLTAAVRELGLKVLEPLDYQYTGHAQFADLADNATFSWLLRIAKLGKVRWLHGGPPYKTFSRARRGQDILRSEEYPKGLPHKRLDTNLKEGNEHARRIAKLAKTIHRAGGFWSIENPEHSFIWWLPSFRALANLPRVVCFTGDQCVHGSEYQKGTAWLTNARFLEFLQVRCPGPLEHPKHPVLDGKTVGPYESTVLMTAEYPELLCQRAARAYAACVGDTLSHATYISIRPEGVTDPLQDHTQRKTAKEDANKQAIGGLRSSRLAIKKLPGWSAVGTRIRHCVQNIITDHEATLLNVVDSLGQDDCEDVPSHVLDLTRHALAQEFGTTVSPPSAGGLFGDLLGTLATQAEDPETEAPQWCQNTAPLGILHQIKPCDIFPRLSEEELARMVMNFAPAAPEPPEFQNYSSYDDEREAADGQIQKELDAGFLEITPDRATLEEKLGPLVPSRIGVIIKTKGKKRKVRLIHDLSRGGVNQTVVISERVVLPRASDVFESVHTLAGTCQGDRVLTFLSLDFKDAFKHLQISEDERRFCSGWSSLGWFAYKVLLFGIMSGPLLWCRVSALIMRLTQAVFPDDLAISCFVDDPLFALAGTPKQTKIMAAVTILLWRSLGFKLSLPKGMMGRFVDWIGFSFQLTHTQLVARIEEDKITDLLATIEQFEAEPSYIDRKQLRAFTGLLEWMAGLLLQLRPLSGMCWAALYSVGASKSKVWKQQVQHVFMWIKVLLSPRPLLLSRTVYFAPPASTPYLMFDASTSGGGALLWVLPAELSVTPASLQSEHKPMCFTHKAWEEVDAHNSGGVMGECAAQARWEAYTLVATIELWHKVIFASRGRLVVIGDPLGDLYGAVRFRSKDPWINRMFLRLALLFAPRGDTLEAVHIWSEANALADTLSRLNEGAALPECLKGCPHTRWQTRHWSHLQGKGTQLFAPPVQD